MNGRTVVGQGGGGRTSLPPTRLHVWQCSAGLKICAASKRHPLPSAQHPPITSHTHAHIHTHTHWSYTRRHVLVCSTFFTGLQYSDTGTQAHRHTGTDTGTGTGTGTGTHAHMHTHRHTGTSAGASAGTVLQGHVTPVGRAPKRPCRSRQNLSLSRKVDS